MTNIDNLYSKKKKHIIDFAFDEQVVNVFPDMIRRSVPGYEQIIALLGVIAERYVVPDSNVYDLGCSLGAAMLSIHSRIKDPTVQFIGVDSSGEMTVRCKENVGRVIREGQYSIYHQPAQETRIRHASLVVMNFTLQFLPVGDRHYLVENIYAGLIPGGALVVSEKLALEHGAMGQSLKSLHEQFKLSNGYSQLEVSQKRTALEQVMVLDPLDTHLYRLNAAGFSCVFPWFQCFGFGSFIAIK